MMVGVLTLAGVAKDDFAVAAGVCLLLTVRASYKFFKALFKEVKSEKKIIALAVVLSAFVMTGCDNVAPGERGILVTSWGLIKV
jgi:hypothetical protein